MVVSTQEETMSMSTHESCHRECVASFFRRLKGQGIEGAALRESQRSEEERQTHAMLLSQGLTESRRKGGKF